MKTLLTLLLLTFCVTCFAQSPKKESKATLSVTPNAVQAERINIIYKELNEKQIQANQLIELIIGYPLEDVDSVRVDNGQFKFVLKPKKK